MSLPKRLSLAVCLPLLACVTTFSGVALAAPAQYVSGPTGPMVNGWYTQHPTMVLRAYGDCNPQQGNEFTEDIAGWSWSGDASNTPPQALPGRHYIEVLTDNDSTIYINNDGAQFSPTGSCPNASGPLTVLWQGYIQWDATPPTVSITSPSNNSNEDTSKITVMGAVSDDASGVASVTVNGVSASVSNGTYSASINLETGINTISVVAKDNAGHQASQSEVVFLREIEQNNSSASPQAHPDIQPSNHPAASSGTTATVGTTTNQNTKSQDTKGSSAGAPSKSTDDLKLVKTVATSTGVSLVTVLSIIIIMLVLDRLGIIEIKLFHFYYVWRKKHYTKLRDNR